MFRRGLAFLHREIDWAAIIGSALALAFCLLVLVPTGRPSGQPNQPYSQDSNTSADYGSEQPKLPDVSFWQRTTGDPVAFFTFVLAVFTATLVLATFFQGFLILRAERLTKIAANAATTQANAVLGVELPFFVLKSVTISDPALMRNFSESLKHGRLEVEFTNHGRTPAVLIEELLEFRVVERLPDEPEYRTGNLNLADIGEIVNAGDYKMKPLPYFSLGLDDDDITAVREERKTLWIYGFIAFRDFLSKTHVVGFCSLLSVHRGDDGKVISARFVEGDIPKYTYRR